MDRKWIGLMAGVILLGWAASSVAGPGWGRGMGPGKGVGMNPHAASYLGLTPEQNSQLQSMREAHLKEIAPLQEGLLSRKQELRLLWTSPNPDQGKITAKQKEIAELQAQLQALSTQHRLEARGILTPEQQQKLSAAGYGRAFGGGPAWGKGRMARGW